MDAHLAEISDDPVMPVVLRDFVAACTDTGDYNGRLEAHEGGAARGTHGRGCWARRASASLHHLDLHVVGDLVEQGDYRGFPAVVASPPSPASATNPSIRAFIDRSVLRS